MSERSEKLAIKRHALLIKIHAQRQILNLQTQEFQQSLGWIELGLQFSQFTFRQARQRPLLGIAAGAALFLIKPNRAMRLVTKALNIWYIWRKIAPVIQEYKQNQQKSSHSE